MSNIIANYVLPVVCPKCGAQILQKSIEWFRKNNELICPCGTQSISRPTN